MQRLNSISLIIINLERLLSLSIFYDVDEALHKIALLQRNFWYEKKGQKTA